MDDTAKALKPWLTFGGCVLVVVVLYWAQAVFVPIALAILLTFVLTPPVTWLQRWTLLEARTYLGGLADTERISLPEITAVPA